MAKPEVPIEVDPKTGVWSTDGLPMMYIPRHFFVNNHKAVEEALGVEAYAAGLYDAGYRSAYFWCEKEAATHGLSGIDVFRHYMKRISQRGWGQFTVLEADPSTGRARVQVDHSVFVLEYGTNAGRKVCYMYTGWLSGALEWVGENLGHNYKLACAERACAADGRSDHCLLEVTPA